MGVSVVAARPIGDAVAYDRWFDSAWGRYAFEVERAILERAVGPLDGRRVLDVGCGTGRFTAAMEQHAGSVIAVDLDPAMLAVAARHVKTPLFVADAACLPFDDATFDVAVGVTLCEFVADPQIIIGELNRVTRPDGRIAIGALNPLSPWGVAGRRHLQRPPWQGAHFVTRRELAAHGRPFGYVTLHAALFVPGRDPGSRPDRPRP
jgi:ubiquinone/menaquinone biosynthesis C-methylase UbiE